MSKVETVFLEKSAALLRSDYWPKIERSLDGLTKEEIWWRPNEASNSIGNLILHLCGNVSEWVLGGVGRRPFMRHRQKEFDERHPLSSSELQARLRSVLEQAVEVIGAVAPDDLLSMRRIQGYEVTVLDAIYHVVEHFSMHTGQIILLSKARQDRDLRLWEPPSSS
jgi:hypothetical protein